MVNKPFSASSTSDEVVDVFSDHIKGLNVLVTGTTVKGLGCEAVRAIARGLNGTGVVICTARSKAKFDETAAYIHETVPNAKLRYLELDFSSKASIRKAADEVNTYPEPLHVLINNAGRAYFQQEFADGHDACWLGNFLGSFLFTNLILEKLMNTSEDPSTARRIINLSSCMHAVADILWDDPDQKLEYDGQRAYGQSKTAMMLFTQSLADPSQVRFAASTSKPRLYAYSVHPGWIHTSIFTRDFDEPTKIALDIIDDKGEFKDVSEVPGWGTIVWKSHAQGVAPILRAAFDPSVQKENGEYITDTCAVAPEQVAPYAKDQAGSVRLWKLCEKQLGQEFNWK